MEKEMEEEFYIIQMEMLNIKVTLSMTNIKEVVDIIGRMVNIILDNG